MSCVYWWILLEQNAVLYLFRPWISPGSRIGATISIVASAFLGQRKVIWLHGKVRWNYQRFDGHQALSRTIPTEIEIANKEVS